MKLEQSDRCFRAQSDWWRGVEHPQSAGSGVLRAISGEYHETQRTSCRGWRTRNRLRALGDGGVTYSRSERIGRARLDDWLLARTGGFNLWFDTNTDDVVIEIPDYRKLDDVALNAIRHGMLSIYRREVGRGGLAGHGALVECGGKGFILSGPSGVGKLTCCERIQSPWKVLCDDQVLILRGVDGACRAHPFPTLSNYYEGRMPQQWNVESSVLLSGICFLERPMKMSWFRLVVEDPPATCMGSALSCSTQCGNKTPCQGTS